MSDTSVASETCGGTGGMLDAERRRATFDAATLHSVLVGGDDTAKQRREFAALFERPETATNKALFDFSPDVYHTREQMIEKSVERTMAAHRLMKRNPEFLQTHMKYFLGGGGPGLGVGAQAQSTASVFGNHYGIFVGAILARASDEQQGWWLQKALQLEITGAYGQTELGHGSNVRGLETTATYIRESDEFELHSPTLTATKWWPGCFGLAATHSIIYARLLIDGKDYGVHEFFAQLRGADSSPLPGIDVGDIGVKLGYNAVDNGYARFDRVRIPREWMLCRYQRVSRDGRYEKVQSAVKKTSGSAASKMGHIVMITTRASLVTGSAAVLAKATTIAVRYSAVRRQGFKNTRADSLASGEHVVLDYQMQQHRLMRAVASSFAFHFAAAVLKVKMSDFLRASSQGDVSALPEIHATVAGLKAFCTNWAGDLAEETRRCCGGHGVLMNAGIAPLVADYNSIAPIAEGDKIVLALQTARFLLKSADAAARGGEIEGQVGYLVAATAPAAPTFTSLSDAPALLAALAWRARNSVLRAQSLFQAATKRGASFDEALNSCAVALVKAAEDHTRYALIAYFLDATRKVDDARCRAVLGDVLLHFALLQVREAAGEFATCPRANAAGLLADRVDDAIAESLARLRPNVVALVDAWGYSDRVLQSTIGRADGNVYEALFAAAKSNPLNRPEYAKQLFDRHLTAKLDADFCKETAAKQRQAPSKAKM